MLINNKKIYLLTPDKKFLFCAEWKFFEINKRKWCYTWSIWKLKSWVYVENSMRNTGRSEASKSVLLTDSWVFSVLDSLLSNRSWTILNCPYYALLQIFGVIIYCWKVTSFWISECSSQTINYLTHDSLVFVPYWLDLNFRNPRARQWTILLFWNLDFLSTISCSSVPSKNSKNMEIAEQ